MSLTAKGHQIHGRTAYGCVWNVHPVATPFIRNSQWHCQALAVFTVLVNFGLDTFPEASWVQFSFFPPYICEDEGAWAAL